MEVLWLSVVNVDGSEVVSRRRLMPSDFQAVFTADGIGVENRMVLELRVLHDAVAVKGALWTQPIGGKPVREFPLDPPAPLSGAMVARFEPGLLRVGP